MPLYQYKCQCGHIQEITHRMADTPIVHCPQCVAVMIKQLSAPQVTFNGSGFYSTDK
jgi:putative FmdB family regulatory protein